MPKASMTVGARSHRLVRRHHHCVGGKKRKNTIEGAGTEAAISRSRTAAMAGKPESVPRR